MFLSGYWPRTAYYLISGSIVFNSYGGLRSMVEDGFSL